jgi:hypothetical protein
MYDGAWLINSVRRGLRSGHAVWLTQSNLQVIVDEFDRLSARMAELEEDVKTRDIIAVVVADKRIAELEAKLARWESMAETRLMLSGKKDTPDA